MRLTIIFSLTIFLFVGALPGIVRGLEKTFTGYVPHTLDIIKSRGFIGEMYKIEKNGYTLTLFRIINPLADQNTLNKYPVLYGHGVQFDSMSMISRSENTRPRKPVIGQPTINYGTIVDGALTNDHSLPFMFSNNNFDVWLYDARGTNEKNNNLSTKVDVEVAHEFWNFSLDDESLVDLPMMIDYVLTKTGAQKLVYVGFSESTFFMFALLSTAPEYADKIVAFVAQAPVAYVAHIKGLTIPIFAPISTLIPEFVHYSYLPQPVIDTVDDSLRMACRNNFTNILLCRPFINGVAGPGSGEFAENFFTHFYKSTSLKAIKHLIQLAVGNRFGMYDFGATANMQKYGQVNPPAYDLGRISSDRIILARGLADFLSTPEDHARLIRELGTKPYKDIVVPGYNHFDFVDGKELIEKVNGPVMLAVYELMSRDGPDILKDHQIDRGVPNLMATSAVYPPDAQQRSSLTTGRNQNYNAPLVGNQVDSAVGYIKKAGDLFNMFRTINKVK